MKGLSNCTSLHPQGGGVGVRGRPLLANEMRHPPEWLTVLAEMKANYPEPFKKSLECDVLLVPEQTHGYISVFKETGAQNSHF